jgi:hypothetical protein
MIELTRLKDRPSEADRQSKWMAGADEVWNAWRLIWGCEELLMLESWELSPEL